MKYRKLSELCEYASDKILVSILSRQNYISTENMLQNRGGICDAEILPSTLKVSNFAENDILISNIRPYFKKIWRAKFCGGCSNDILVMRAKQNCNPIFLYYILSSDSFFSYATHTSKGTKMPRGDKKAIMNYQVPDLSYQAQKIIGEFLNVFDRKIELNNKLNDNLAEILQTLYQQQFCYSKGTGNQGRLADLCDYSKTKVAVAELSLSTYYSTENMLPGKAGAVDAASLPTTAQATKCQIGDVLISNIRPYFKKIVYCHSDCGCSADVLCFTPKVSQLSAYLYRTLYVDSFFDFMVAGSKGTKMPRGDKQQIMAYVIHIPTEEEIRTFNKLAIPILGQMESTHRENMRLSSLRDSLLPKLMSGELDVSELDI